MSVNYTINIVSETSVHQEVQCGQLTDGKVAEWLWRVTQAFEASPWRFNRGVLISKDAWVRIPSFSSQIFDFFYLEFPRSDWFQIIEVGASFAVASVIWSALGGGTTVKLLRIGPRVWSEVHPSQSEAFVLVGAERWIKATEFGSTHVGKRHEDVPCIFHSILAHNSM